MRVGLFGTLVLNKLPEPAHRARPPHPTRTLAPSSTHDRAVPQRPVFSPTTERFPHSPARRCDAPPGHPREPRFTAPPGVSLRPPRPASPASAIRCAAGVRASRRAVAPAPAGPSPPFTVDASTRAFAQCSRVPPGREQIPAALPPPVPDAAAPPDGTLPPPAVAPPSRWRSPPPTELPPPSSRSVSRHRSAGIGAACIELPHHAARAASPVACTGPAEATHGSRLHGLHLLPQPLALALVR